MANRHSALGKFSSLREALGRLLYLSYTLSLRDFRQRYQETALGLIWVIVQPLSFLIVVATVVHFGLRGTNHSKTPYIVFLATGFIPWLFFSTTCVQLTSVFRKYAYVVKNVNVPSITLFFGVFFSNIYVHLLLAIILMAVLALYGFLPNLMYFQLFYYSFACAAFVFAVSLITASFFIFFRDIEKLIPIIMQFGFWFTPILWDKDRIPTRFAWLAHLNPMEYVVSGYRDTILHAKPFFDLIWQGVYFWGLTLAILTSAFFLFKRLSPHFIEVL